MKNHLRGTSPPVSRIISKNHIFHWIGPKWGSDRTPLKISENHIFQGTPRLGNLTIFSRVGKADFREAYKQRDLEISRRTMSEIGSED